MTFDYYGQTAEYNTSRCRGRLRGARRYWPLWRVSKLGQYICKLQLPGLHQCFHHHFEPFFWLGPPHRFVPPYTYTLPTMTNIRYAVGLPLNNPLCHQLKHQLTSCEAAALTSTANTRKPCQTNPDGDTEQIWIPEVSSVPLYNYPKNTPQP